MSDSDPRAQVLHYVGYDDDRGGIVSVVRALARQNRFDCVLGLNRGAQQRRVPALAAMEFAPLAGEVLSLRTLWRARGVATAARRWLAADPRRVVHGHSRAGLLVALWLAWAGERRVVASVHCYGRKRWLYRHAARALGPRLFWLTPTMREWYGVAGEGWAQCIPGCAEFSGDIHAPPTPSAGGGLRLGGVGALVAWKRWDLVLDALALLEPAELAQVSFEHVGGEDGSAAARQFAAALRARAAGPGLAGCVSFGGEEASSVRLLGAIDALVVASENEPFSVAMLEALQAGVPVLAADSGGARDVVRPPANGWLFRSGDAADLARTLRALLVDTSPGRGARIEREALLRFRADTVAGQWARVYAGLPA